MKITRIWLEILDDNGDMYIHPASQGSFLIEELQGMMECLSDEQKEQVRELLKKSQGTAQ